MALDFEWLPPQRLDTGGSPTFVGLTLSGLTAGRVPIVSTGGLLADDSSLVWNTTNNWLGLDMTPANTMDVGGSLGMLNKPGAEKVTNGTFTGSATGWTYTTPSWTYAANAINKDADGVDTLAQSVSAVANEVYRVEFTVSGWSVGTVTVSVGGVSGTARGANGTYIEYICATGTGNLIFTPTNTSRFTLDTVSVKRVATAAADHVAMWIDDRGGAAGKAALFIRVEDGTIHVLGDLTGIGTTEQGTKFQVSGTSATITHFFSTDNAAQIALGDSAATNKCLIIGYEEANNLGYMEIYGGTRTFSANNAGNLGIGTTTFPSGGGVPVVCIVQASGNPTGMPADRAGLFAKDVGGVCELFGIDDGGTVAQLTPHPSDILDDLPVEGYDFPFAYRSENPYLGKKISVDWVGVIKALEKISGKSFMKIETTAKRSWADDQDWHYQESLKAIAQAKQVIADLQAKIAVLAAQIELEESAEALGKLIDEKTNVEAQLKDIKVPVPYKKKNPPKWMALRGVK